MKRQRPTAVGDRPESRSFGPVTQTHIVRFAGAGGDFNPLHHDPAAARAAGFDGPIAMGQMTAGILGGWLTDWCGVQNLRSFEVRFVSPVRIGNTIDLSGEVVDVVEDANHVIGRVDLVATVDGAAVVTGTATFLVDG